MNATAILAGEYVDAGMHPADAASLAEADAAFEGARTYAAKHGWRVSSRRLTPAVEAMLYRQGYRPCLFTDGALRVSILGVWVKPRTAEELAALDATV